jgi:Spy/CpxP family protein refolding chaperone
MKKIMIGAVVLMLAAGTVQAQDNKQIHEKHHRQHHGKMFEKLNFTQEQKDQMKSINNDFRKQMQDLKKNEDITVKDRNARKESLSKSHKEQIQNLLTNDQKVQLEKMKQEHRANREAHANARMEKMAKRLNLNKEQKEKLVNLRSGMSEKIKTIRSNESLTEVQKKDQVKELMKTQKEEMKSILTDEQFKKMEEMKSHHGGKMVK